MSLSTNQSVSEATLPDSTTHVVAGARPLTVTLSARKGYAFPCSPTALLFDRATRRCQVTAVLTSDQSLLGHFLCDRIGNLVDQLRETLGIAGPAGTCPEELILV